ncbi:hypothetical protein AC1031_009474 [Aphanomyces cochlioides]|nr:hypothetical protein AC1031_009474 [Aphanomyces cochlioides]
MTSCSSLLQHSRVVLNVGKTDDLPAATSTANLTHHLLNREVFQYDFSKERELVESYRSRCLSQDVQHDEELAKSAIEMLNAVEEIKPQVLGRRTSADDLAAAIAASLKDH